MVVADPPKMSFFQVSAGELGLVEFGAREAGLLEVAVSGVGLLELGTKDIGLPNRGGRQGSWPTFITDDKAGMFAEVTDDVHAVVGDESVPLSLI